MVVITSLQRDVILDAVRAMYTDVARYPNREFHFPTGRAACEFVGYPRELLDRLPEHAVESFAGVGYPFLAHAIKPGDTVLDIGSGSGTDVFSSLQRAGQGGQVYALDLTTAMRDKLAAIINDVGATNVIVLEGDAEDIPLPDACVDVVTSNGVLNLVPDKRQAFAEIARVLRAGGRVQIADIVLAHPASDACRSQPQLWAECIVGATTESDYLTALEEVGLVDVRVLDHRDYFSAASRATRSVAESLGAVAIVLTATKPKQSA
ncbi:MAG: methyltransferase domain-containing protein [Longimicrobiales bacterium]